MGCTSINPRNLTSFLPASALLSLLPLEVYVPLAYSPAQPQTGKLPETGFIGDGFFKPF